ncbi:hypothetical protein PsYK624_049590 [Phanerochaete sordida]|uniref:Uncharacterized protein n=1 Tax=Phanerochaete sordida TaxID=48140 RepID=A0A9P3LCH0_9APHY|nr:hypothetical protein PsYK624_049590 [Phanerochaete sordida]
MPAAAGADIRTFRHDGSYLKASILSAGPIAISILWAAHSCGDAADWAWSSRLSAGSAHCPAGFVRRKRCLPTPPAVAQSCATHN